MDSPSSPWSVLSRPLSLSGSSTHISCSDSSTSPRSSVSSKRREIAGGTISIDPKEFKRKKLGKHDASKLKNTNGRKKTSRKKKTQTDKSLYGLLVEPPRVIREVTSTQEGSPWDPTPRKVIDIDTIDLSKSYEDAANSLTRETKKEKKIERQKRWKHTGKEPLLDAALLPEGWNAREPDLHEMDIEGQIERCKERIEDNIMPFVFENRLKEYEARKSQLQRLRDSEAPGLSWDVLHRIQALKEIETGLHKEDESEQLINVKAILSAYRQNKLRWTRGLVTYWAKGEQISQPRPFNWDEYEAINAKNGLDKGFWVEGFHGPGPASDHACVVTEHIGNPAQINMLFYHIAVRLPRAFWWTELRFLYDTGASQTDVYESDLPVIAGPGIAQMPVIGTVTTHTATGSYLTKSIQLEVTVIDNKGRRISPWTRIAVNVRTDRQYSINDVHGLSNVRHDGNELRKLFYFAQIPNGLDSLHIANKARSLRLPEIPWSQRGAAAQYSDQQPPVWLLNDDGSKRAVDTITTENLFPSDPMLTERPNPYPPESRGLPE